MQFVIDIAVELASCFIYYTSHLTTAFFHIGLVFYLSATKVDLKLRLQEIFANVDIFNKSKFECEIFHEIKFHGCLYAWESHFLLIVHTITLICIGILPLRHENNGVTDTNTERNEIEVKIEKKKSITVNGILTCTC